MGVGFEEGLILIDVSCWTSRRCSLLGLLTVYHVKKESLASSFYRTRLYHLREPPMVALSGPCLVLIVSALRVKVNVSDMLTAIMVMIQAVGIVCLRCKVLVRRRVDRF